MKKMFFLVTLMTMITELSARQLYKVHCLTPAGQVDRTKLARYIHLDMINTDSVEAVVNDSELKALQKSSEVDCEVQSSFDTDKTTLSPEGLNQILVMSDSNTKTLEFFQDYIVSSKTKISINLNQLLKQKLPGEDRSLELSAVVTPQVAQNWRYDKSKNLLEIFPGAAAKGKVDHLEFSSPVIEPQVVRFLIDISYR